MARITKAQYDAVVAAGERAVKDLHEARRILGDRERDLGQARKDREGYRSLWNATVRDVERLKRQVQELLKRRRR